MRAGILHRARPRPRATQLVTAVIVSLVGALMLGTVAWAEPPKVFKIGILTSAWSPWHDVTLGFRDHLKELGYLEGRNVAFEVRTAQGDLSRLPGLAHELVQAKPHLLYCVEGGEECRNATTTIPIVFTLVSDPVRVGLVKSLARPGGNITGIANLRAELTGKRLELFKATVPSLRRVLITYDPREPDEQEAIVLARSAARQLGLTLLERPITAPLEIETGLALLEEGGQDGILIVQAGTNLNIPGRSLEVATSSRLPTMYPSAFWAKFGALASYGPDPYAQGRQAARLAQKILTGTPPGELPVELPDRIEFIVNLKTAGRLRLTVPQPVLLRADRIIE